MRQSRKILNLSARHYATRGFEMKTNDFDVDIDVSDRDAALSGIVHVGASIGRGGELEQHNTGVYVQAITHDPATGRATIDHKEAAKHGYFKLDFLNVHIYDGVRDEAHLLELMDREPDWEFFTNATIVGELYQVREYADILARLRPQSIEDLAMILAIIRPAKAYLRDKSWELIRREVWIKNPAAKGYHFKRSHAISYAAAIVVQLNLLIETAANGPS